MVRTRTSASCDQEPIHEPASGSIIRGRDRGRGRCWGTGRIAAPVEGELPMATRAMIGQYLLMQMLFMGMCLIVSRGMDQLRLHPVLLPPSASRYLDSPVLEVKTPNPMVDPDSRTPRTQSAAAVASRLDSMKLPRVDYFNSSRVSQVVVSGVPFQKVVDTAKELEMIRHEGF
ncbi:hypothetical protein H5410_028506 [Solanum commersonii]|uniref:Uncharacterized protein n=1 Tax=Solanum commersonii TaxID=4109 RepID=A0A9J5Z7Q7_SOLCO|nr:hypothetical protein H5410_028506 [Solanum commersonii]